MRTEERKSRSIETRVIIGGAPSKKRGAEQQKNGKKGCFPHVAWGCTHLIWPFFRSEPMLIYVTGSFSPSHVPGDRSRHSIAADILCVYYNTVVEANRGVNAIQSYISLGDKKLGSSRSSFADAMLCKV